MNTKKIIWIAFALMVGFQIIMPLRMISTSEEVLESGQQYKFKIRPVDPVDPFRGKYIRLRYEAESKVYPMGENSIEVGSTVYAAISTNEDGFAEVDFISIKPIPLPYLIAEVSGINEELLFIDLPHDKYFMNEYQSQPAEDKVRELLRTNKDDVYAMIYINGDKSMLEGIYINDMAIENWLNLVGVEKSIDD